MPKGSNALAWWSHGSLPFGRTIWEAQPDTEGYLGSEPSNHEGYMGTREVSEVNPQVRGRSSLLLSALKGSGMTLPKRLENWVFYLKFFVSFYVNINVYLILIRTAFGKCRHTHTIQIVCNPVTQALTSVNIMVSFFCVCPRFKQECHYRIQYCTSQGSPGKWNQ